MFGKICVVLSFILWLTVAVSVGMVACILLYDVYERMDHSGAERQISTSVMEEGVAAFILTIFTAFFATAGPFAGLFAAFFWRWSGRKKRNMPVPLEEGR